MKKAQRRPFPDRHAWRIEIRECMLKAATMRMPTIVREAACMVEIGRCKNADKQVSCANAVFHCILQLRRECRDCVDSDGLYGFFCSQPGGDIFYVDILKGYKKLDFL